MSTDHGAYESIAETVMGQRAASHPEVPASLLQAVVDIEVSHIEDSGQARAEIEAEITKFLRRKREKRRNEGE